MTNPFHKYGVDREAEAKGAPIVIDDMVFIVRSATAANRGWRYALALAARRHRAELESLKPTDEDDAAEQRRKSVAMFDVNETLQIEAFADCVMLGWENVSNGHNQPLPFNFDNCVRVLQGCPQIWDTLKDQALDVSRFKIAADAAQEDGEQLGKS